MMGEGQPRDFKCCSQSGQHLELVRRECAIIRGRSVVDRGTSVYRVGKGFGSPGRGRGACLGSVHLKIERRLLLITSSEHFLRAYHVSGAEDKERLSKTDVALDLCSRAHGLEKDVHV